ncbi:hypothetical protein A0O28_0062090 [Trichoderma guizhouense]|uniref:S-adenosylmethionine-dependent methyltransferase-like protein n=1 Tax=Trichoderma guizhouense TaxID=1491466 RepID=A0A1T3CYA4_9HYPO|nr:hypothetical protein A0O28_0062090 [Trichoderma guizhouense]
MPSFRGLGKHSNRSQHAVAEASPQQQQQQQQLQQQQQSQPTRAPPAPAEADLQHPPHPDATPQSALRTSALSSSESFNVSQQQQQQQQQLQLQQQLQAQQQQQSGAVGAGTPALLFHSGSSGVGPSPVQNPAVIGPAPAFDGRQQLQQLQQQHQLNQQPQIQQPQLQHQHQQPQPLPPQQSTGKLQKQQPPPPQQQQQQPGDFAEAASAVRQSQRYSASLHHLFNVSQTSLNELTGHHQGQAAASASASQASQGSAPEKRSARKIIKGIFSGRNNHDNHRDAPAAAQNYDNTVGLARRPSKRISHSNPPNVKTGLSPQPDRDWHTPNSSVHQTSPLQGVGEAEEYGYDHDQARLQHDPRLSVPPINTIREAHADEIQSPYDDYHHSQQQLPPPPQLQQPQSAHPQVLASQDSLQQQQFEFQQQQQQQQQQQFELQIQQQQHQQLQYDPQQAIYDQQGHPQQQQQQLPQAPQQYYTASSPQDQYQQTTDPRIVTTHLGQQQLHQQQNPETISQLSRESPAPDSDQRSLNQQLEQQPSPAVHYSVPAQESVSSITLPPVQPTNQQQLSQPAMAPPGGGAPTNRADKALPGAPPGYRHTHTNSNMTSVPGAPLQPGQQPAGAAAGAGAAGAAAGGAGAPPRYEAATGDQGRNSPQPSTHERDNAESEKAFKELLTKYKNVKRLYFDGKSQIEQLNGQIEHLQNAVANQRMSQSRTALDDNEYVNRFNRLNGAINNLSFNIRKDWRRLPQWLEKFVSPDALKTGKQEMTAVGRAVITKWIVDEVFNKCFHPDLDTAFSSQLKEIELHIRGNAYTMHSQEEFDALTTKVVNWRMATLDGLQHKLNSTTAGDNRAGLIAKMTTNLAAHLYQFLIEPPPAGVEGSTSMIVELAIGIAANLPRESRDVTIMYPLPGDVMQAGFMEVEKGGLPSLDGQKEEAKVDADADKDKSSSSGDSSKAGFKDSGRVRFAGFVAIEVRGRQVLMKAPVWTL